jgi:hypothetical protein
MKRLLVAGLLALAASSAQAQFKTTPDAIDGGVYNATLPTLADRQHGVFQLDANGRLIISGGGGGGGGPVTAISGAFVSGAIADLALAQNSTTAGEVGNLPLSATTTSAPTYTTAKSNPLSTDTAGNLRTVLNAETSKVIGEVNQGTSPWVISGAVTGTFWQTTQPVSGTFYQTTQPASLASAQVASGAFASGSIASGAVASGAIASGAFASGAFASGAGADGWNVTQGAKADAASTATDTTAITQMQVEKQISKSVQAIQAGGVGSYFVNVASTTLTRAPDTTQYTANTTVCLAKTVTACVPITASIATANAGKGLITRVSLLKSGTATTSANFTVWMFSAAPLLTTPTQYDNVAYVGPRAADMPAYIGSAVCSSPVATSDTTAGVWYDCTLSNPNTGGALTFQALSGQTYIDILVSVNATYTPAANSETFIAYLSGIY